MIKKVRDSFPWGTKISRREGCSILEAVLCHLNLVPPWDWGELEQDWEGTGSRGPLWMDSVTYLSFSYQKNRCKGKKKKISVTIPIFALHKPPTADAQQLHHSLF